MGINPQTLCMAGGVLNHSATGSRPVFIKSALVYVVKVIKMGKQNPIFRGNRFQKHYSYRSFPSPKKLINQLFTESSSLASLVTPRLVQDCLPVLVNAGLAALSQDSIPWASLLRPDCSNPPGLTTPEPSINLHHWTALQPAANQPISLPQHAFLCHQERTHCSPVTPGTAF